MFHIWFWWMAEVADNECECILLFDKYYCKKNAQAGEMLLQFVHNKFLHIYLNISRNLRHLSPIFSFCHWRHQRTAVLGLT
jgi:hypothetical protein